MENLVCAELTNGISSEMFQDKMVVIINDGGLFAVTTEENAKKYTEEFYSVDAEVIKDYGISYSIPT